LYERPVLMHRHVIRGKASRDGTSAPISLKSDL
jgi:hypothetical protein